MKTYWVLSIVALGVVGEAAAQEFTPFNCPQLGTLEQSRAVIERLRADREAGIDRLPTAEHRELANRSLYQWYWPRLAELDRATAEAEAACRAALIRSDEPLPRPAPLPEPSNDPFEPVPAYPPPGGPPPTMYDPYPRSEPQYDRDPFGGPVDRSTMPDPFEPAPGYRDPYRGVPTFRYQPYRRYPSPQDGPDPFGGPVDRATLPDPFEQRGYPQDPREYRYPAEPRPRAYPRYRGRAGGWEYEPGQPVNPFDPFSGR